MSWWFKRLKFGLASPALCIAPLGLGAGGPSGPKGEAQAEPLPKSLVLRDLTRGRGSAKTPGFRLNSNRKAVSSKNF